MGSMMGLAGQRDWLRLRPRLSARICHSGCFSVLIVLLPSVAPAAATAQAPPALTFGEVTFQVHDIYAADEVAGSARPVRFLRETMNTLHAGTRHYVLRRELLFDPGDPFDAELLAETERNLRALGFLRDVRVAPTDTLPDGRVPVLVTAQDAWTLKTELAYSRAGEDQRWSVVLADDNFLGHAVGVGLGVGRTEDFFYRSLSLRKRRLLDRRWEAGVSAADLGDGYALSAAAGRPFYALDDPWGLEARAWREDLDQRFYLSNAGPAGEDPSRARTLYATVRGHREGVDLALLHRLGRSRQPRIWRLGAGLAIRRLAVSVGGARELSDGRVLDLGFLDEPGSPLAREEGRLVHPYLAVESRGRDFTAGRFLLEYGPVEDIALAPTYELRVGPAFDRRGAPRSGARLLSDLKVQDWSALGPGFLLLSGEGEASTGSRAEDMAQLSLVAGWVATTGDGPVHRQTRLFAEGGWGQGLLGLEPFILGLGRGLRTLEYDGMVGDRLLRWNAEHGLILPTEVLGLYRLGAGVFYAGGMAWWRDEDRGPQDVRHEAGFGLRFGPTRSARGEVARLDLTWPLDGGAPVLTAASRGLF